jgi:ketosteroid isomerase-like protein
MERDELEARLRDAFDRWNRGDYALSPDFVDPDVEILSATGPLGGGTYRGYEGYARWIADMSESFDEWVLRLDELETLAPDRVLVVGAVHFRGRGSGVDVDLPCAWLMNHREGVLTRMEAFPNRVDEARAIAERA